MVLINVTQIVSPNYISQGPDLFQNEHELLHKQFADGKG